MNRIELRTNMHLTLYPQKLLREDAHLARGLLLHASATGYEHCTFDGRCLLAGNACFLSHRVLVL